jgi:hypothetical protein
MRAMVFDEADEVCDCRCSLKSVDTRSTVFGKEEDEDDDDDDNDVESPPDLRDPNMQSLSDHNIPTYAQDNGAYLSTKSASSD